MRFQRGLQMILMIGSIFGSTSCVHGDNKVDFKTFPNPLIDEQKDDKATTRSLVIAGGCFWCTEGVFAELPGVTDVVSGYAGGTKETANYEAVCSGTTKHAEVVQIIYDPTKTSLGELLKFFFSIAHDPTQLNGQGPDRGTQYRSAIFFNSDEQKLVAQSYIKQLDEAKVFAKPIVTTLEKLDAFYPAEKYHQDFAAQNPDHPYIKQQATPKMKKLEDALKTPATQPAK